MIVGSKTEIMGNDFVKIQPACVKRLVMDHQFSPDGQNVKDGEFHSNVLHVDVGSVATKSIQSDLSGETSVNVHSLGNLTAGSNGKTKAATWKKRARVGFIPKGLVPKESHDLLKRKEGPDIKHEGPKRLKSTDVDGMEVGSIGQPRQDE